MAWEIGWSNFGHLIKSSCGSIALFVIHCGEFLREPLPTLIILCIGMLAAWEFVFQHILSVTLTWICKHIHCVLCFLISYPSLIAQGLTTSPLILDIGKWLHITVWCACDSLYVLSINRGHFSSNNSRKILRSSPVRARYGVSIVGARSDWSFTVVFFA